MKAEIDNFFLASNLVNHITEEDYKKAELLIDAAKSFARSTYQCVYIVDFFKGNFLYASDNMTLLCGEPTSKILDYGFNLYINHVPPLELEMLKEINKKGLDLFSTLPISERTEYSIRYDFHFMNGKKSHLTHHSLTPYKLTDDGKIWLALCTISVSSHITPGHIVMRKEGSRKYFQYDTNSHKWTEKEISVLSENEREVLVLSAQGYTMSDISDMMCKSIDTIKAYKRALFAKLDVRNIVEALYNAVNYKLL